MKINPVLKTNQALMIVGLIILVVAGTVAYFQAAEEAVQKTDNKMAEEARMVPDFATSTPAGIDSGKNPAKEIEEKPIETQITVESEAIETGTQVLPGNEIYASLFEKYKVAEEFKGESAPLDFSGNPGALDYKTRITNGYNAYDSQNKSNIFAGHYVFTAWGCGTSCRLGVIIDLENGKIYQIPGGESEAWPEWGYYFTESSNLLIINPIEVTRCTDKIPDETIGRCEPTKFYLWENNQFKKLSINQAELISTASESNEITEKATGIIKQVYEKDGKNYLDIDYIQFGICPDMNDCGPSGLYMTNDNPRIRSFEVDGDAVIKILPDPLYSGKDTFYENYFYDNNQAGSKNVSYKKIAFKSFMTVFNSENYQDDSENLKIKPDWAERIWPDSFWNIGVAGGKITEIREQSTP